MVLGQDRPTLLQEESERARDLQAQQTAKSIGVAVSQGELPPNAQLASMLDRGGQTLSQSTQDPSLSPEARAVAQDLQGIISGMQRTLLEKNQDEALQKVALHTHEARKAAKALPTGQAATAQEDLREVMHTTYELAKLLTRSAEFRGLVLEMSGILSQIILGRTAEQQPGQALQEAGRAYEPTTPQQPPSARSMAKQAKSKLQQVATELGNEDTQTRIADRLQVWLGHINRREDFRQGVRDLVNSLDNFAAHAAEAAQTAQESPETLAYRIHAAKARHEAKKLLERFADNHSLDPLIRAMRQLANDVQTHERLREYMIETRTLINYSLDNPEYVQQEGFLRDVKAKISEGRALFKQFGPDFDAVIQEGQAFMQAFTGDPALSQISQNTQSLVNRLFFDEQGKPTLKPGVLLDLRKILGPLILEELKYIYIPRISGDDESMTWIMENLLLRGEDVLPDKVVVENYNKAVISPVEKLHGGVSQATAADQSGSIIRVHLTGIRAHLENVHLAYKRKTFPKMEDIISFDAHVAGQGLNIEIILAGSTQPAHLFRVASIVTQVDDLSLQNIHGMEHSHALYTILKPILQSQARRNMATAVTEAVQERLSELDQMLVKYREQIQVGQ